MVCNQQLTLGVMCGVHGSWQRVEETGAVKSPAQPDEQSRKHMGQVVGGSGKRSLA